MSLSFVLNKSNYEAHKSLYWAVKYIKINKHLQSISLCNTSFSKSLHDFSSDKQNALRAFDAWGASLEEFTEKLTASVDNFKPEEINDYKILMNILRVKTADIKKTRFILYRLVRDSKISPAVLWQFINLIIRSSLTTNTPLSATTQRSFIMDQLKHLRDINLNDFHSRIYSGFDKNEIPIPQKKKSTKKQIYEYKPKKGDKSYSTPTPLAPKPQWTSTPIKANSTIKYDEYIKNPSKKERQRQFITLASNKCNEILTAKGKNLSDGDNQSICTFYNYYNKCLKKAECNRKHLCFGCKKVHPITQCPAFSTPPSSDIKPSLDGQ